MPPCPGKHEVFLLPAAAPVPPDRTAHCLTPCLTPCLHALGSMGSPCSLLPPLSPLQNAQIALLHFCLNPCLSASCRRCSPTAGCPGRQFADAGGGDGGDAVQDQQQVSPPAFTQNCRAATHPQSRDSEQLPQALYAKSNGDWWHYMQHKAFAALRPRGYPVFGTGPPPTPQPALTATTNEG